MPEMDTSASVQESTAPLSVNQAASFFSKEPEKQPEAQASESAKVEPEAKAPEATQAEAKPEPVSSEPESDETITIEVDGKSVEIKKSELAEKYKDGLRQADYTRKTMEVAEQRKAADAETAKARQERNVAAQGLREAEVALKVAISEQEKIDWDTLIQQDPQEYLKQKHLLERRQAALHQTRVNATELQKMEFVERVQSLGKHLQAENQALLDTLPQWKDQAKAKAERDQIAQDLLSRGFNAEHIFGGPTLNINGVEVPNPDAPGITDHRLLVLAREAMLYRQMMSKAQAAAKKVSALPQRTEKPGVSESNPLDGRTSAMKRLEKSGSVRDAASLFSLLRNKS